MKRIEVTRSLAPVMMPARLLNEIHEHALDATPEECCGLVLGEQPGAFARVRRCHNDMTKLHAQDAKTYPRSGAHAFHMREQDYLRVQSEGEAARLQVTAVYHSHVNEGLYFSEDDQSFALQPMFPFPDACHIVVSVVEQQVKESGVFTRTSNINTNMESANMESAAPFLGRMLKAQAPS